MTIQDAMDKGLEYVRLPIWEPSAYLKLSKLSGGGYGPWCKVHDVSGDMDVLLAQVLNDDIRWEACPDDKPPSVNS